MNHNTEVNNEIEVDGLTIPVIQEYVTVSKEIVETGKVLLRKTISEEEATLNIPLIQEKYNVERVPVNKTYSTQPAPMRHEGETIVISVVREVPVIQIHYEVVEEIRLTKQTTEIPQIQQVTLTKESVHVERVNTNGEKETL